VPIASFIVFRLSAFVMLAIRRGMGE
jgi:hypothetical protein